MTPEAQRRRAEYAGELAKLLETPGYRGPLTCFAIVAQRCKTLLRTLGLWKD